jgi:hypothetical protein
MIRFLLVVATGFAAIYFSNLASASLVNSVLLPFLAFACLVYLLLALTGVTVRGKSGSDSTGGGGGWSYSSSSCDSNSSGDCGGGDGGGGD